MNRTTLVQIAEWNSSRHAEAVKETIAIPNDQYSIACVVGIQFGIFYMYITSTFCFVGIDDRVYCSIPLM